MMLIAVAAGFHPSPSSAGSAVSNVAAAPAGFPVTVENCGRELTFEEPPRRVVTGYQNTLEMLLALGLEDRIVGRLGFDQSPLLPDQAERVEAIPELAPTGSPIPREVMLSTEPDFFFANGEYEVDGGRGAATLEELARNGAQVYVITSRGLGHGATCTDETRSTIEYVYQDILNIGTIFGVPDRAEVLVAKMQSEIADVQSRIEGTRPPRALVYDSGEGPLFAVSDRYFDFALARADNIFGVDDVADQYPEVDREVVAAADPEVFVTVNYEAGPLEPEAEKKEEILLRLFPNSSAAENQRVVALESIDTTPGIRNAMLVRQLAEALHPEAF